MQRGFLRIFIHASGDQAGQMSIFIALIFQVLFVFFAMVVNIGLLVHDKINLQNAVDLAAYYAAQRQAEILNEMAHINYQLRQDYKLMTWRYRVVGTLGRQGQEDPNSGAVSTNPPARRPPDQALSDREWINPIYGPEPPVVCAAHHLWSEMVVGSSLNENYCWRAYGDPVPRIPSSPVIAPWVPLVFIANRIALLGAEQQVTSYEEAGPFSWAVAMQILLAYKRSISVRKQAFYTLRERLLAANFVDMELNPVRDGVLKTIRNNLTESNNSSFEEDGFELLNGFAQNESCQIPEFVLPEINTTQLLLFSNFVSDDLTSEILAHPLYDGMDSDLLDQYDPGGAPGDGPLRTLARTGEPGLSKPEANTALGFEKNPWCMAYVGVKASTRPRKPFAPFGQPIQLTARAFAQPFGGRIGPWYMSQWAQGAPTSGGGERIDPLTPARLPLNFEGTFTDAEPWLPNHSRYPGDALGLKSELALGAQRHIFLAYESLPASQRLKYPYYAFSERQPQPGDFLAWDPSTPNENTMPPPGVEALRRAEIAALAPDLFDATYYSVEPSYWHSYGVLNQSYPARYPNLVDIFAEATRVPLPFPDLGGRNGHSLLQTFGVENQIQVATGQGSSPGLEPQTVNDTNLMFYPIRHWHHLLTDWAPHRVQNFSFPEDRFAKCVAEAHETVPIPGKCRSGGRVGYSVRLLSREHLYDEAWEIGGPGIRGPILNPPPRSW